MSISESLLCTSTIEYPFQKNTEINNAWGDTNSRAAGYSSNALRTFLKLNN